jgi:hypothetical protein
VTMATVPNPAALIAKLKPAIPVPRIRKSVDISIRVSFREKVVYK